MLQLKKTNILLESSLAIQILQYIIALILELLRCNRNRYIVCIGKVDFMPRFKLLGSYSVELGRGRSGCKAQLLGSQLDS